MILYIILNKKKIILYKYFYQKHQKFIDNILKFTLKLSL